MYFRLNALEIFVWLIKTMCTTRGWIVFNSAATAFHFVRFLHTREQSDLFYVLMGIVAIFMSSYLYLSYLKSRTCESCHYNRVDCLTRSVAQGRFFCLDKVRPQNDSDGGSADGL